MKLLLPPLALFLFSASVRDDEVALRFAPAEGTVLKRVFDAKAEYHLAEASVSIAGESREMPGELPDYEEGFTEHIAVTDRVKTMADGHPSELVRTFDELGQDSVASQGEEEEQSTSTSPLEGRTVRFTWDEGEGAFQVAADDDKDLDAAQAAELLEDMDLRRVLPSKEVAEGDEWELDPKLYLAFMWPSGLLDFHGEGEEPSEVGRQTSHQTIERLEGSGTARLEEVREEDGVRVAVIHVELTIQTGSEHVLEAVEEGDAAHPELQFESEIERELSGTIVWDLEHGHARSAELECKASRVDTRAWNAEDEEGGEVAVETSQRLEGTIHYSASVERE